LEWAGVEDLHKTRKYEETVRYAARKSFGSHRVEDMFQLYKLALQVLAHYSDPSMKLHHYARFLMKQQVQGSPYLLPP